jgi:uncharacterized protein involved in type VI secretion and phage assembly
LGKDVLQLQGFSGQEANSSPFQFHPDLFEENQGTVAFDKLPGQRVSVTLMLPAGAERYFSGILSGFSQGGSRSAVHLLPRADGSTVFGC